jgi:DNA-binding MarR family transcriptional regulator
MSQVHQMQQTSLEAYHKIEGSLGWAQSEVLRVLRDAAVHGFDMTNSELAQLLKWSINRVTPRVKELRDQGLVVVSRKRVCGVTGFTVLAWKARALSS